MRISLAFKPSHQYGVEAHSGLHSKDNISRFPSKIPDLGRAVLLGKSERLFGQLGKHPWKNPDAFWYPPHQKACNSLMGRLGLGPIHEKSAVIQTECLDGSLAIIGGPVANPAALLIFGRDGKSPLLNASLPIGLDISDLDQSIRLQKETWKFIIDGRSSDEEHLLMTSLPMFGGERLINITSLRGLGHLALDEVLRSEGLMEKINRETKNKIAWQIIFKIEFNYIKEEQIPFISEYKIYEINNVNFDNLVYISDEKILIDKISKYTHKYNIGNLSEGKLNPLYSPHSGGQGKKLNESKFPTDLDREIAVRSKLNWLSDGKGKMNPAEFVKLAYKQWLNHPDFTRAHITRKDFPLSEAYASWIRPSRHPEDDLKIPTATKPPVSQERRREQVAKRVKAYRSRRLAEAGAKPG